VVFRGKMGGNDPQIFSKLGADLEDHPEWLVSNHSQDLFKNGVTHYESHGYGIDFYDFLR